MTVPTPERRCVAIVPVKPPARGKSRLAGLPDALRSELAAAFARDTIAAALATSRVERVLVMTDDARFAATLDEALPCDVLPDGVGGDLNGSLVQAARESARRWPDLAPVALCADLPALRPRDLDAALAAWRPDAPGLVADVHGVGTTLYVARGGDQFSPRFGPSSRAEHVGAGAREIEGALPSLRQDVDDAGDLGRALVLGVGSRTAAAWGRDEGGPPRSG